MASQNFEDVYGATCDCNGENLVWEWDAESMYFVTTCSCYKQYTLTPVEGVIEMNDSEEEFDEDS